MAQATGAANRILSMRSPKNTVVPNHAALHNPSDGVSVEFKNVCFEYKSRDTQVLYNLNLHVAQGKLDAIVGASGCGK